MKFEINGQTAEKLFLPSWEYNVVRIQNELKRIIENEGGEVVRVTNYWPKTQTYVVNRALNERIDILKESIACFDKVCPQNNPDYKTSKFYLDYIHELEHLESIPNDPVLKTGASAFVLNGIYYGLIFEDNPFFDTHYLVAKVYKDHNDQVFYHSGYKVLPTSEWKFDCLFQKNCSLSNVRECANLLWNLLQRQASTVRGKYVSHVFLFPTKSEV